MLRYNGSSQFMIKIFSDSVLGSSVACSRNDPPENYCSLELLFSQGILCANFLGLPQILFPQIIVFSRDIIIFSMCSKISFLIFYYFYTWQGRHINHFPQ